MADERRPAKGSAAPDRYNAVMEAVDRAAPAVRTVLLGVAGRRLSELRESREDAPLAELAHDQLERATVRPGDRVYVTAYSGGRLALVGRIDVDSVAPPIARARAPYCERRFDRIVAEEQARMLRSCDGAPLRFLRVHGYELHPAALLRPIDIDPASAQLLDRILQPGETPARPPDKAPPYPTLAWNVGSAPAPRTPPEGRLERGYKRLRAGLDRASEFYERVALGSNGPPAPR